MIQALGLRFGVWGVGFGLVIQGLGLGVRVWG